MAVKEKRREKKKQVEEAAPEIEMTAVSTAEEKPKTEDIITPSATVASEKASVKIDQIRQAPTPSQEIEIVLLPQWGTIEDSEWMYGIPARDEDRQLWAAEWSDFILKWMKSRKMHILSIAVFVSERPFKDLLGKTEAFRTIGEALIDQEIAEWLDNRHRQLRVYWRPLEEWAIETGNTLLDVKTLVIREKSQQFSTLPERDLRIIFGIMVTRKQAQWVDQKIGAVRLVLAP